MQNNLYNLMIQCVQEQKSLWRIKDDYLKDAEGNTESRAFWEKMIEDKALHVTELTALIKAELE